MMRLKKNYRMQKAKPIHDKDSINVNEEKQKQPKRTLLAFVQIDKEERHKEICT